MTRNHIFFDQHERGDGMTEEKAVGVETEAGEAPREESPEPEQRSDRPLQFDKAEFDDRPEGPPVVPTCATCNRSVESSYYLIGETIVCASCREQVVAALSDPRAGGRFGRAALYGSVAALLGTVVWYAIRKATGYEIGLVAIGVGIIVGIAVKKGSGGLGGKRYQALAVALTYASIALANLPEIVEGLAASPPPTDASAPAPTLSGFFLAWGILVLVALASPFLMGFQNIIGILIIGIGLYEAWKITRYVAPVIRGPFEVSREAESTAAEAVASGE